MTREIVIPSYRRADTLATKTLPLLDRLGVDLDRVSVFLSDPAERDAYEIAAADYPDINYVDGASGGAGANRNAILDWLEDSAGHEVISFDDDISDVVRLVDSKTIEPISPREWWEIVLLGFDLCSLYSTPIWGVNPTANPYFLKPKWSTDLRYIPGGVHGLVAGSDALRVDFPAHAEDYLRTLQVYDAHDYLPRCNYVGLDTVYYTEPGGLQEQRTPEMLTSKIHELHARYPDYMTIRKSHRAGIIEPVLNDKTRTRKRT